MNAAALLKVFFNTGNNPTDGVVYRYADLCAAMAEVEAAILHAAKTDSDEAEDAEYAGKYIQKLWSLLSTSFERNGKAILLKCSQVQLPNEFKMALRTAERIIGNSSNSYTEERRNQIRDMVSDIPELLRNMLLPRDLKQYVMLLAKEVETALDEYDVVGDFKLDSAFTRLQTSLNVIAVTPQFAGSRSKLTDFLVRKVAPCCVAATAVMGFAADSTAVLDYLNVEVPLISASSASTPDERHGDDSPAAEKETAVLPSDSEPL